jgi:hypothetical protein
MLVSVSEENPNVDINQIALSKINHIIYRILCWFLYCQILYGQLRISRGLLASSSVYDKTHDAFHLRFGYARERG